MPNSSLRRISFLLITTVLVAIFSASGCEPLRKKFTRQKKTPQVLETEPVLEPVDYPAAAQDPREDYKYRFSLVSVYKKDFLAAVEDRSTSKRVVTAINDMIAQMEAMKNMLRLERQKGLVDSIEKLRGLAEEAASPQVQFDLSSIKIRVSAIVKSVQSAYALSQVQGDLIF